MSTVGLTKAQHAMLEWLAKPIAERCERPVGGIGDIRTRDALMNLGLLSLNPSLTFFVTPRGHAALAAPRMTQAELDVLEGVERRTFIGSRRVEEQCRQRGWLTPCVAFARGKLTPAGRTALNNVRAAKGSPDYKEGL